MRTHAHTHQALAPSSGPGAGQLLAPTPEPGGRAGERRRSVRAQPWAPGQRGRPAWTPRHFLRRLHAPSLAPSGPPHRTVPPAAAGSSQSPTQGSPRRALPYLPAQKNLSGPPAASRLPSSAPRRAGASSASAPGVRPTQTCCGKRAAEGPGPYHSPRGTGLHQTERLRTPIAVGVGTRWEALG